MADPELVLFAKRLVPDNLVHEIKTICDTFGGCLLLEKISPCRLNTSQSKVGTLKLCHLCLSFPNVGSNNCSHEL